MQPDHTLASSAGADRLVGAPGGRIQLQSGVLIVTTLLLAVLVILPVYHLVLASFTTKTGLSLANYAQVFSVRRFQEAMANSLLLGATSSVFGMLIGTALAWLVSRTNVPFRRLIRNCVLASFAVPAFVNALSWVLLAGPNAGSLNQIWKLLTGSSEGFINIFSMQGLVIVSVATVYPLAFILMYNAFETMDTEMEHAARLLGASATRAFLSIALPLARPAIIAGFIVTFLEALALYGAPAVIGVPARVYVITTQVWSLFEYPPQIGVAAALSLPLALVTIALLWLQRVLIGRRSFGTIRGKAGRWQRTDLGAWKWAAAGVAGLIVFVSFILPNAVLVFRSLYNETYGTLSFSNLTFAHYKYVLVDYIDGVPSIRNSLITSVAAATVAVFLALVAAFVSRRKIVGFGWLLAFLCMLPLAIPSMVFAVGLVAAYSTGWIVLYGTLWIMMLAYLTKNLPYAYMSCNASLSSIHVDLESAARVLGASTLRALKDITAPLIRNGILSGWIVVFANSLRDLSASVLLYTSATTVISTAIMDVYYASAWGAVAALSVILLGINMLAIAAGYRIFGRNVLSPNA
jgi:iron(III) transport system permease protein